MNVVKRYVWLLLAMQWSMILFAREQAPIRYDAFDGGRIGAKAQSMGYAFTAVADTADAPYWNPAGMLKLPCNLFIISLDAVRQSRLSTQEIIKGEPLHGRSLTFLSFTGQNGALGFRPMSDIDETITLDDADPDNNYENRQVKINSFFLSGGSKYNDNMLMGITLHYLNGRLSRLRVKNQEAPTAIIDDGNGFSCDVSLLYCPNEFFNVGIMGLNIPGIIYWGDFEKTNLPPFLRVGTAIKLSSMMTLAYDYEKRFYRYNAERPRFNHIGIEHIIAQYMSLRGGMFGESLNNAENVHYTAGIGFTQRGYYVDLSMEKYDQKNDEDIPEKVFDYNVSISIPFSSLEPSKKN